MIKSLHKITIKIKIINKGKNKKNCDIKKIFLLMVLKYKNN